MNSLTHIHLANLITTGSIETRRFWIAEVINKPKLTTLESFWKKKDLVKHLGSNPEVKIFLDSGAYSLLSAQTGRSGTGFVTDDGVKIRADKKKDSGKYQFTTSEFYKRLSPNQRVFFADKKTSLPSDFVDFSFTDSPEIRAYVDDYIKFIHKYKNQLLEYVNLDIIFNAEKSWEIQQYMESNGLRPIPVFHYGEDYKWLIKYAEEYDYIGIGGVGTGLGMAAFERFADRCFEIITEIQPNIKVHGFAVTAFDCMMRWPWYSVDSTAWLQSAAYGSIMVPCIDKTGDAFDFTVGAKCATVSNQVLEVGTCSKHFCQVLSPPEIDVVKKWVKECGIEFEMFSKEEREYPCIPGYLERQMICAEYYTKLLASLEGKPFIPTKIQKTFF